MIEIVIPWVPDQECNPNNHKVSERTRIRHRKQGAEAAHYPMREAFATWSAQSDLVAYLYNRPVRLDITVRWGYRQRSWDSDNLVTAMKYLRDALQRHGIVLDDKLVQIGSITQERATTQPETILRIVEAIPEAGAGGA